MKRWCVVLMVLGLAGYLHAERRPRITGIAQVRFYTSSPTESSAFYGKVLGFDQSVSGSATVYTVNALQSIAVEPLPSPAPRTRMEAVVFRTDNAAALQRYLRSRSIEIVQPLHGGTFGVHDPEGNLILFTDTLVDLSHTSPRAVSRRMIHAGFVVRDRAAEDRFYRDLLGFHLYWQGGQKDDRTDYVAMQVPDGSDWLEYMLNSSPDADAHQMGGMNHISLGLNDMADAVALLRRNGCVGADCKHAQLGRDGKIQLNLFDPDLTRTEYMEFKPVGTPCCSPIQGKTPVEVEER